MGSDRNTLNLAAAVLCGIGSLVALLSALLTRGPRDRAALLSGLLGTIGSAAWAMAAYDDLREANEVELSTATP